MKDATRRQGQILEYIRRQQDSGFSPSVREIAEHFHFRSPRTVSDHLDALRKKGLLRNETGVARSFQVTSPLQTRRSKVIDIPVYGSIPAGFGDRREQEAEGCVSIDINTIGIKPTTRTAALQVRGDSMIGKYILDGDFVIVEHGQTPRNGDVVAALIDGYSTLKTYVANNGKPFLKAENPKYPKLIPAAELVIQGVMVALIRKRK